MKLQQLLQALDEKEFYGNKQQEINSIVSHSADAGAKCLFVAISGSRVDGHDFLESAYRAGVRAFVTQRPFYHPEVSTILVPDARLALAKIAAEFYGHPSSATTLIGITGTNGKTTTAYLLEGILKEAGFSVGVLSTVEYRYGNHRLASRQTTLEPVELQQILRTMIKEGIRYVIMEVSSQGLDQKRVDGCDFDIGIFTNLTPEHLDYHKTMENYYASKERFFTQVLAHSRKYYKQAIINQDDPMGRVLLERMLVPATRFGITAGDIQAQNIDSTFDGISAELRTPEVTFAMRSPLLGIFNLYNIMAASGAALALGIAPETIIAAVEKLHSVPGRMERVANTKGCLVLVDYAHTGDALEHALKTLKSIGSRKIITVFGCGGDRDREKRPVMGRVAAQHRNVVIITSDNPRSEPPEKIIREIEAGVIAEGLRPAQNVRSLQNITNQVYCICVDRAQAIHTAISSASAGDIVLIAGKGHETTQQIGDTKIPFDDREEARRVLERFSFPQ